MVPMVALKAAAAAAPESEGAKTQHLLQSSHRYAQNAGRVRTRRLRARRGRGTGPYAPARSAKATDVDERDPFSIPLRHPEVHAT